MSDSNKALKEKLLSSRKNGFDRVDAAELEQMEAYCKEYMTFLSPPRRAGRIQALGPGTGLEGRRQGVCLQSREERAAGPYRQ